MEGLLGGSVFTEIDFEAQAFVGKTRAAMKLVLVMSERAVAALLQKMP